METSQDKHLNPQLKKEVQGLRGSVIAQAHKNSIPDRFICEPHPDKPSVIITDTETGESTEVPLFAYGEVRNALTELFS